MSPVAKKETKFLKQNTNWGACPNVPLPEAWPDGTDILLKFHVSYFRRRIFEWEDCGLIRFHNCTRFRFTPLNDEGWYRGQCRFSEIAPEWGEFYGVIGDFKEDEVDREWTPVSDKCRRQRNFLFYFRDETFECSAESWSFDGTEDNALYRANLG